MFPKLGLYYSTKVTEGQWLGWSPSETDTMLIEGQRRTQRKDFFA